MPLNICLTSTFQQGKTEKRKRSEKPSLFCSENPGDDEEKHRGILKMRVPWELSEERETAQAEFSVSPILSSQKCLHC